MAFQPGARFGNYEITRLLGIGGMGEVYRATDTRLQREVALKVLPTPFLDDADRLARFQREARVLASLNHPSIAAIHGVEHAAGIQALVLELVDGATLAERIATGPIPLDESLPIAQQIAEALEAAHGHGIVHRDLKPANIKLRSDGAVKVLDFGLARALDGGGADRQTGREALLSPTITSPAMVTGLGVILGTAAYMAPEQAKGKAADKRADLWAFGCVLYEMLTGRRAFEGEDVSETLANVLRTHPDMAALPAVTPAAIHRLLRRCLEKDHRKRLADAADARLEIEDALMAPSRDSPAGQRVGWRTVLFASAAALIIGGAAAATGVWFATRPPAPRVTRLLIPTGDVTITTAPGKRIALTPDGSRVVYYGGAGRIFVRPLAELEPMVLTDMGVPTAIFLSPDGQWIGIQDESELKKVPIGGGPALRIAAMTGNARGATWGPDGTIVFADAGELRRIAVGGGDYSVLAKPDPSLGETDYILPEFLPDGRAVLYSVQTRKVGSPRSSIAILDLETGTSRTLVPEGRHAKYVSSGHLIYGVPGDTEGSLLAVGFDLRSRTVSGTPVPVLSQVMIRGGVQADVSADGTLVYVNETVGSRRTLVWVERSGREEPLGTPPQAYAFPRLSPDKTRIVFLRSDQGPDLWIWDIKRRTQTRVTSDPQTETVPLWLDDRRLVFTSNRLRLGNLFVQRADGLGTATRVTEGSNRQFPTGVTPDGQVVFYEGTPDAERDIRLLTFGPPPTTTTLVSTRFDERGGTVSPDGRWLAYESNSTGRYEIYVRPFPAVNDNLFQVSSNGGVQPRWSLSGSELFYVAPDGALWGVPVPPRKSEWAPGPPVRLVDGDRYYHGGDGTSFTRQYDVDRDGRFLLLRREGVTSGESDAIVVVQNWLEELRARVPNKVR